MNIVVDGLRSQKWRAFAQQKLWQLRMMGLPAKTIMVDGYRIALSAMDEIAKATITSPPGAVAVGLHESGEYRYFYADQYGADLALYSAVPFSTGAIPLTAFSSASELVSLSGTDYLNTVGEYAAVSASWYAPRPNLPADPSTDGGYVTKQIATRSRLEETGVAPPYTPPDESTMPQVAYSFTNGGVLYLVSTSDHSFYADGEIYPTSVDISVVAWGASRTTRISVLGDPQNPTAFSNGWAFFARPIRGQQAMMLFVFYRSVADTPALVRAFRIDIDPSTLEASATQTGAISPAQYAAAYNLNTPGGDPAASDTVLVGLLGGDPWTPLHYGYSAWMFSVGADSMCCYESPLGENPAANYAHMTFHADGSFETTPLYFPIQPILNVQFPQIDEVADGYFCCKVHGPLGEIIAVYYGTPFAADSWIQVPPLDGAMLNLVTVHASPQRVVAVAVMYVGGYTRLFEYDSESGAGWQARGTVCAGLLDRPSVALFGGAYGSAAASFQMIRRTSTR